MVGIRAELDGLNHFFAKKRDMIFWIVKNLKIQNIYGKDKKNFWTAWVCLFVPSKFHNI